MNIRQNLVGEDGVKKQRHGRTDKKAGSGKKKAAKANAL
jgi:hypothetical protein